MKLILSLMMVFSLCICGVCSPGDIGSSSVTGKIVKVDVNFTITKGDISKSVYIVSLGNTPENEKWVKELPGVSMVGIDATTDHESLSIEANTETKNIVMWGNNDDNGLKVFWVIAMGKKGIANDKEVTLIVDDEMATIE